MTARDQAIEAGARASALWHRGETITDSDDLALVELVVDAVEPIIRADERERDVLRGVSWKVALRDNEAEVRERLRAQVEALRIRNRTADWDYHRALDDMLDGLS